MEDSRAVTSPGAIDTEKAEHVAKEENEKVSNEEGTIFRRAAARINYISRDRPDLGYASKELSRGMSSPTKGDIVALKRVLRYLKGNPQICYTFKSQGVPPSFSTFCDSDWAGCRSTRRSTSGGAIMYGDHLIHHWSSTQSTVALSSAEAELNSIVKSAAESLGLCNMLCELGLFVGNVIRTDSSAAKGICCRRGTGEVKHLECKQLWIQEFVSTGRVVVEKIPRALNISGCLTHHWSASDACQHFYKMQISVPHFR